MATIHKLIGKNRGKKKVKYIAFDGIDGCGKSDQIKRMIKELNIKKKDPFVYKQAVSGATLFGKFFRRKQSKKSKILTPKINPLIFAGDSLSNQTRLKRKITDNQIIIGDRSSLSIIAYGKSAFKPFKNQKVSNSFLRLFTKHSWAPDLIFILDVEPEEAMKRIQNKKKPSMFEKLENLNKERKEFIRLSKGSYKKEIPKLKNTEVLVIKTTGKNSEEVWRDIRIELEKRGVL